LKNERDSGQRRLTQTQACIRPRADKEELERVRNELQGITKLTAEMREQLQAKDSEISRHLKA